MALLMCLGLPQTSWSGNASLASAGVVCTALQYMGFFLCFWQEESAISLPDPLIAISLEYLSGAPNITGMRVPVQRYSTPSRAASRSKPSLRKHTAAMLVGCMPDDIALIRR
jgi:hypothetical protein